MLAAVKTVRPAFEAFYATLTDDKRPPSPSRPAKLGLARMALADGIAAHPVLKSVRAKQTAKVISPLIWGSDLFLSSVWRADIH